MKDKMLVAGALLIFHTLFAPPPVQAFRFISWADTKDGTSALQSESVQAAALNPIFTIYPGDVCSSGPDASCFATWKNAMNGGSNNGMFDKSFVTRGNHDSSGTSFWPTVFKPMDVAVRVGATNFRGDSFTYSFDYQNAHFIGVDVLGGVSRMSSGQVSWIDSDLTAAEGRGLTHAFLFWHGPIYPLAEHCCSDNNPALNAMLNKHPIVSATFHGHEHVVAYVHINSARIPGTTHEFESFVTGDAGAGPDSCTAGRFDYCMTDVTGKHGFAAIDVSGNSYTVGLYALGTATPVKTYTFTKGNTPYSSPTPGGATPTSSPAGNPSPTSVVASPTSQTASPTTVNQSPTPVPSSSIGNGDANGDGKVDFNDAITILSNWLKNITGAIDQFGDGKINAFDFALVAGKILSPTGSGNPSATPVPTGNLPSDTPVPTNSGPTPTIPQAIGTGIWISQQEIAKLPTSGAAWSNVKGAADGSWGSPELANQDSHHPQYTLAGALVYAKTGQTSYKDKVITALKGIMGTESGARSLALGRNLAAYAVAADLIGYQDQTFKTYMSNIRKINNSEGRSLISCHEERPNNWGTMCGASRIAIDIYIGDKTDLDRAAKVFKGYLGDRASYAGFQFGGSESWMCDPTNPRPINPPGCIKDGHDLSGAPVDDVRRGGDYTWPPTSTNYAWGGFSAAAAQAEMLYRAGYDAFNWESQAVKRGMNFLQTAMASSNSAPTDWMPWVVNYRYGTNFSTKTPTGWGRLMGWTDWTHAR